MLALRETVSILLSTMLLDITRHVNRKTFCHMTSTSRDTFFPIFHAVLRMIIDDLIKNPRINLANQTSQIIRNNDVRNTLLPLLPHHYHSKA